MNERIKNYVSGLFKNTPNTRRVMEMQEELLSNMNEKYEDLIRQGKSEEEAFSHTVSGIGDIDALVADITEVDRRHFTDAAAQGRHRSLLISSAVFLYIFSLAAAFLFIEFLHMEEIGAGVMLTIWALATAILVYAVPRRKKYQKKDDTFVEEYKEKMSTGDKATRMSGAITSSLWTLITLSYFILSFGTGRWDITWIIFLIGVVLQQVIMSLIHHKMPTSGMIWTTTVVLYLMVSFTFGNWNTSWLLFLAAAAVQQLVRLYRIWREV